MSQFKFSPGWYKLSPCWQVPAALVLTILFGMHFTTVLDMRASLLEQDGRTGSARYYTVLSILIWLTGALVFLPRTHNTSRVSVVRLIGRIPLLVRFLLLVLVAGGLFEIGTAFE